MSVKNDFPKTCFCIAWFCIAYNILRLCSSILNYYNNNHKVNVNTFCKCKHMTLFWGKKNPAEKWRGKKISCRAFRRKKNILLTGLLEKKKLADQKSSTPPTQELNGRPLRRQQRNLIYYWLHSRFHQAVNWSQSLPPDSCKCYRLTTVPTTKQVSILNREGL